MKKNRKTSRGGFSLLELIVTTAMLATLTTSCMVIVRTSYTAWNRHEDDHATLQGGQAVLRHIVRQVRQARAVMAISLATDDSGSLSLLDVNGNMLVWEHDAVTKQVLFGITIATNVLATGIEELTFVGYKVDDLDETTDPGLIHKVQCTTKVNIARPVSTKWPDGIEPVTTSNQAWLRVW